MDTLLAVKSTHFSHREEVRYKIRLTMENKTCYPPGFTPRLELSAESFWLGEVKVLQRRTRFIRIWNPTEVSTSLPSLADCKLLVHFIKHPYSGDGITLIPPYGTLFPGKYMDLEIQFTLKSLQPTEQIQEILHLYVPSGLTYYVTIRGIQRCE